MTKGIPIMYEWVKGHSDSAPWKNIQDLILQQLSRDKIFNIWCDRMADNEWTTGSAPCINQKTTPAERWAVFSKIPQEHKLIGDLSTDIPQSLSIQNILEYLKYRHNLDDARIEKINFEVLQVVLSKMPVFRRASLVKLLHRWTPTYSKLCRQGRETSSVCPRCKSRVKTHDHVYQCEDKAALQKRSTLLNDFLYLMVKQNTPMHIIACFSYKLSIVLNVPQNPSFTVATQLSKTHHTLLIKAIQHQNLIGWNMFLRGFTSCLWFTVFSTLHNITNVKKQR